MYYIMHSFQPARILESKYQIDAFDTSEASYSNNQWSQSLEWLGVTGATERYRMTLCIPLSGEVLWGTVWLDTNVNFRLSYHSTEQSSLLLNLLEVFSWSIVHFEEIFFWTYKLWSELPAMVCMSFFRRGLKKNFFTVGSGLAGVYSEDWLLPKSMSGGLHLRMIIYCRNLKNKWLNDYVGSI